MVANPRIDLLAPVCPDNGCQCSTAGTEPAEQIPTGAGSELPEESDGMCVTYPDWRREELARKYSDDEPIERERGFYHPYG